MAGSRYCSFLLAFLGIFFSATFVLAEDWPTYRHDNERSGATKEQLELPLKKAWAIAAPAHPKLAWAGPDGRTIEGKVLKHRVNFDDCFHATVVGKRVFFGSSVDHQVRCVDLETGKELWHFFTGGPVRLAPTVWQEQVFFGSDDGWIYSLDATTGKLVWQLRGGPEEDFVLGRGELISRWPVRTGITIHDGVAYVGTGLFPHEDVFLHAIEAKTGKILWKLDDLGEKEAGRNPLSPQGYLLTNAKYLFVPSGRALPVCFERKTGKLVHQRTHSWRGDAGGVVGGTQALLADDWIYAQGDHHILAMDQKTGNVGLGYIDCKQMAVAGEFAYIADGKNISKLERQTFAKISVIKHQMKTALGNLAKAIADGKEAKKLKDLIDNLKKAQTEIKGTGIVWSTPLESVAALVVAGDHVFVGGEKRIDALDGATGKIVWSDEVDGDARGLAVANGHLLVSTTTGKVYAFADSKQPVVDAVLKSNITKNPFPKDNLTKLYEDAAQDILKHSGIDKGFCLMLGAEQGRLAYELAQRSDLRIYAIEPDKKKVDAARATLSAAGLYGHRIVIHHADLADIPYCSFFANLVVSDSFVLTGKLPGDARHYGHHVKPLGGVVYLNRPAGAPGQGASAKDIAAWLDDLAIAAPGKVKAEETVPCTRAASLKGQATGRTSTAIRATPPAARTSWSRVDWACCGTAIRDRARWSTATKARSGRWRSTAG
jgi:outer membrane protein assembly factor BamB